MESPEYYTKKRLVLGCGNILFGDDGFGPAVADYILSTYAIPEDAAVLNLGLSTRGFIFDILLAEKKPERIIIVDAVSVDHKKPGEIFELSLDNLVREKVDDFSFHQGPTSNMLKELRDLCGVGITIVACQPDDIPEEITRGLSEPVRKAVLRAGVMIYDKYLNKRSK
jgi:coenzyme F420 hydrogenase subunit delta